MLLFAHMDTRQVNIILVENIKLVVVEHILSLIQLVIVVFFYLIHHGRLARRCFNLRCKHWQIVLQHSVDYIVHIIVIILKTFLTKTW